MTLGKGWARAITIATAALFGAGGATTLTMAHSATSSPAAHAKKSATASSCKKRNKPAGVIKFSDWQFPDTLNQYQASASVDGEVYDTMLDYMTEYNNRAQLIPVLLAQLPTQKNGGISKNGKTITLHLRKGMHWSNGTEVTSRDVKFGWQVDMNPSTGPYCKGTCDVISRIDTPSKYIAVLHLKHIFATAIPVALPDVWPASWTGAWSNVQQAADKLAKDQSYNFEGSNYPTDGPYQVSQFSRNDRIVLTPMKYYSTLSCGAYVKNLIFAFYSSKDSMLAAADNDQTDITTNYTPADTPSLLAHKSAFKTYSLPSYNYEHLEMNVDQTYNGKANPLSNTNVRLAIALAIDKIGVTQSSLGLTAKQAAQVVGWTPWINTPQLTIPFADKAINGQWDPIQKKYVIPGRGKAVTDAKKLLASTPYKNGFTLDFTTTSGNPTRAQEEAVIAANLHQIGITVNPLFIPASTFFSDFAHNGTNHTGHFQITMFTSTLTPSFEDIKYRVQSQYIDREAAVKSSVNYNYSGIHDSILDRDLTKADQTYNKAQRTKLYDAVQVEMNRKAYWDILYFRPVIYTADSHVRNFLPGPASDEWNVYNWRAKGGS